MAKTPETNLVYSDVERKKIEDARYSDEERLKRIQDETVQKSQEEIDRAALQMIASTDRAEKTKLRRDIQVLKMVQDAKGDGRVLRERKAAEEAKPTPDPKRIVLLNEALASLESREEERYQTELGKSKKVAKEAKEIEDKDAPARLHEDNLRRMVHRILNPMTTRIDTPSTFKVPDQLEKSGKDLLTRREKLLEIMDAEQRISRKARQENDSIAALQAQRLGELREAAKAGYQQAYRSFNRELVDELFKQENDLAGGAWTPEQEKEAYKRIVVRTALPCIQNLDQEFEELKRERLTVENQQEKGRLRRMCEAYAKLKPWQRVAIGAVAGTAITIPATIFLLPSMGAAAGGWFAVKTAAIAANQSALLAQGAAGYATYRVGRTAFAGTAAGGLRKLFDARVTKRFKGEHATEAARLRAGAENNAQSILDEAGTFFGNAGLEKRGRLMELMMNDARKNAQTIADLNRQEQKKKSHLGRGILLGLLGGGIAGALTDMVILPRVVSAATIPPLPPGPGAPTPRASLTPPPGPGGAPPVPTGPGTPTFPRSANANILPPSSSGPDTSGLPGPAGSPPDNLPLMPPRGKGGYQPFMDQPQTPRPAGGYQPAMDQPQGPVARGEMPPYHEGHPAPGTSLAEGGSVLPETGVPLAGPHGAPTRLPAEILPEEGVPLAGPHGMPLNPSAPEFPVGVSQIPPKKGFFQSIRRALFGAADDSGLQGARPRGYSYQPAMDQAQNPIIHNPADAIPPARGGGDLISGLPGGNGGGASHESLLTIGRRGPEGALIDAKVSPAAAHRSWLNYVADIKARPNAAEHQQLFAMMRAAGYSNDQIAGALKGNGTEKLETLLGQAARRMKGGNVLYDPSTGKMQLMDEEFLKNRPRASVVHHQPVAPRPRVYVEHASVDPNQYAPQPRPTMTTTQEPAPPVVARGRTGLVPPEVAFPDQTAKNMARWHLVGHFADQAKTMENVDVDTFLAETKNLIANQRAGRPLSSSVLPDAHNPGYLDHYEQIADELQKKMRAGRPLLHNLPPPAQGPGKIKMGLITKYID